MTEPTRRQKIVEMLVDEPHDTFLNYCLAMEMDREGDNNESLEILEKLTKLVPPHVPAYFMAGQQLTRLERINEARAYLREGIEAARLQHDDHAAAEMSEFLMSLGSAGE
jgi:tetratricopeptide (TPR) repeat protein